MRDLSTANVPFLAIRQMDLGPIPAIVGRITFTGDLGYEIWVAPEYQRALFDLLWARARSIGIGHFGGRALNSMRLEKSFGTGPASTARSTGHTKRDSAASCDLKKNDFIGRDGAAAEKASGGTLRLSRLHAVRRQGRGHDRRRAGLARRQGRRLGHIGRLRRSGRSRSRWATSERGGRRRAAGSRSRCSASAARRALLGAAVRPAGRADAGVSAGRSNGCAPLDHGVGRPTTGFTIHIPF